MIDSELIPGVIAFGVILSVSFAWHLMPKVCAFFNTIIDIVLHLSYIAFQSNCGHSFTLIVHLFNPIIDIF